MDLERVRAICGKLPGTTQDIQWGDDLLFRIGGKIYLTSCLNPALPARLSFKCTPEEFAELTERDGIVPAAYVARYNWVTLERWDALSDQETERFIRNSYQLVRAKLPKKLMAKTAKKARK
jgi:predicted DNA-binding protein (MmcQ/YjbR family)